MKLFSSSNSYILLSKKNLLHNLQAFYSVLLPNQKLAFAVKGNAYGHGQDAIVSAVHKKVDYFFVHGTMEFHKLRLVSKKPVLLLGYVAPNELFEVMQKKCILTFFSIKQLELIDKNAQKLGIIQEVHLPIDAHLGREGFIEKDCHLALIKIQSLRHVRLSGMYAHFANIEDVGNFTHAKKQLVTFRKVIDLAKSMGFKNLTTHLSSTAGVLVGGLEVADCKIVRPGIGLYGLWPSVKVKELFYSKIKLKPVLSWRVKIAMVKTLDAFETVGYGLTFKTKKPTKIAIIPVGYADGLDRALSNKGEMLVSGKRCAIIGRISMNMTVINVDHLKDVKEGDEVVIIGQQGKECITADELAEKIGTINYEIVTRISPLLPRIII